MSFSWRQLYFQFMKIELSYYFHLSDLKLKKIVVIIPLCDLESKGNETAHFQILPIPHLMGPDVGLVYFNHTSAFSYHDTIPESFGKLGVWKEKSQIISDILGSSFSAEQNTRWEQESRFKSHIFHLLLITVIPSANEFSEPHSLYLQNKDLLLFSCLSRAWLFVTPQTAACQACLSFTIFWSLLKLMSIESVMPSNCVVLFTSCLRSLLAAGSFPMSQLFYYYKIRIRRNDFRSLLIEIRL